MTRARQILIVEDNPANQLLATAVLERGGFAVDIAESAAAAFDSISISRPDLILMDIQLGGENGLDLTLQLKNKPATASIPVVALTARAMAGDRQQAIAAGCSGYIPKPIDTRTFVDQIKAFFAPASQASQ